jgi:hypothetical protein
MFNLAFAKSTDEGTTFGTPVRVSSSPVAPYTGIEARAHSLAASGNNVYIAFFDGSGTLVTRTSTDAGNTFAPPVDVSDGPLDRPCRVGSYPTYLFEWNDQSHCIDMTATGDSPFF